MQIGFIGTGVMGTGMIMNLLKAGYEVKVFNRTKAHAQTVLEAGAKWADSPKAATENSDFVLSIVGFPQDVEEIYFGKDGILSVATPEQVLIDMTTSSPAIDRRIADYAQNADLHVLDAPVSGGDIGARKGTLTIMVGGDAKDFRRAKKIFSVLGSRIEYFGGPGMGQQAKMANQIMIAGTMVGMCEALAYARAAGLDLDQICSTINSGAAANWSLENYGPRILRQDYTPGFFAKHFLKDLRIALEEADRMHLNLPGTDRAKELYEKLVVQKRLGNDGTQALVKLYWK